MTTHSFESVLREVLDARLADVHTAIPAQVLSYDAAKQLADIQVMVKDAYYGADDTLKTRSFPVLPSVPVVFPRGGGMFLSLPLAQGDTGLLVFCELPIDRWRSTGQESHPLIARRHGVANAVFYPGLAPRAAALDEDGVADNLVLGAEGGAQVHVTPDAVLLGGFTATQKAAVAELVQAEFAALKAALLTAFGVANAVPAGPAAGSLIQASALTSIASYTPSAALGAQKVKVL